MTVIIAGTAVNIVTLIAVLFVSIALIMYIGYIVIYTKVRDCPACNERSRHIYKGTQTFLNRTGKVYWCPKCKGSTTEEKK